jgi:lipoate-protein ligase A
MEKPNVPAMASAFSLFDQIALWRAPDGANGAGQMAFDEVMLRLTREPTLRIYRWAKNEVTFGYPQRWDDAHAFARARPLTRRCTGGGFVEHGEDTTIALAVPAAHPFSRLAPAETYRQIHAVIREALDGPDLLLATEADCSCGPACFASPAPADILLGSQKITGGAQRRSREGFLYQGSIQAIAVDEGFPSRLADVIARSMADWTPPAGWEDLHSSLVETRYGSEEWNRRR